MHWRMHTNINIHTKHQILVFYQTQVHRLKAQMEKMEDAESESSNTRTENETIRRWVYIASNNGWDYY